MNSQHARDVPITLSWSLIYLQIWSENLKLIG